MLQHASKEAKRHANGRLPPVPTSLPILDEGWEPRTSLPAGADASHAATLLLSHTSFKAANNTDAAYVLSLFGACEPAHQLGLLTAVAMLCSSRPTFPVVVMLGDICWTHRPALRTNLAMLGAVLHHAPEIANVTCFGRRFGPDSKPLPEEVGASYFDATYTILAAWNLTSYRAVMVLDSDLVVLRSLDHVLLAMLARPEIAEARTPEGCLDAIAVHPWRGNFFNTGVWGVRPQRDVFKAIVHYLQNATGELQCGIGIQTAAKGFFGRRRIDPMRFDPNQTDRDRHSVGALPWLSYPGHGPSPAAEKRRIFTDPRMRPWEILQLHAGYNLKANQGAVRCLRKHRHPPETSAYVIHWSGSRKPYTLKPHLTFDQLEKMALDQYMQTRCRLWTSLFADAQIPHFDRQCSNTGLQASRTAAGATRAAKNNIATERETTEYVIR